LIPGLKNEGENAFEGYSGLVEILMDGLVKSDSLQKNIQQVEQFSNLLKKIEANSKITAPKSITQSLQVPFSERWL